MAAKADNGGQPRGWADGRRDGLARRGSNGTGRFNLVFDADDTLWHSNIHFLEAEAQFVEAMKRAGVAAGEHAVRSLVRRAELEVIETLGYGRGPYVVALRNVVRRAALDEGKRTQLAQAVEEIGRRLMEQRCELLPGVEATLSVLAQRHRLLLFTKGQFDEQHGKLDASGLRPLFSHVAVVREKDLPAYRRLLSEAMLEPEHSYMIGNSPRSDINPALQAGLGAVYIPYPQTWEREHEEIRSTSRRLTQLDSFHGLLELF